MATPEVFIRTTTEEGITATKYTISTISIVSTLRVAETTTGTLITNPLGNSATYGGMAIAFAVGDFGSSSHEYYFKYGTNLMSRAVELGCSGTSRGFISYLPAPQTGTNTLEFGAAKSVTPFIYVLMLNGVDKVDTFAWATVTSNFGATVAEVACYVNAGDWLLASGDMIGGGDLACSHEVLAAYSPSLGPPIIGKHVGTAGAHWATIYFDDASAADNGIDMGFLVARRAYERQS